MKGRTIWVCAVLCSLFGVAIGAVPQGQAGSVDAQPPQQQAAKPKPTNIKALPSDISGGDLDKLMHQFKLQLGVPCEYCHAENAQTGDLDYASDANPVKETARFMIRMTSDINTKYLAQLGSRRYSPPFNCGSCHQGQPEPAEFVPKPR